jgi:DNA-binding response OmpR family regulator
MQGKVVVVAEDDELLRSLYERKFTLAGYTIFTAESGEHTLELLETTQPDLLIIDINMPGIDGFQVIEKLPAKERTYPILMLSNFADDQNKARTEELKVDMFLEKQHTTIKELLQVVQKLVESPRKKIVAAH